MGLLRKWRKKRRLRYIPSEFIYEPLYKTLRSFNEDIPITIGIPKKEDSKKDLVRKKPRVIEKIVYRSDYAGFHDGKFNKEKSRVYKDKVYKPHYGGYDATFKVVLFGDTNTGKATLTQKFLTNLFKSDTRLTVGVDFEVKSLYINDKKIKLQIWDFGGEERFRFLIPTYVRGASGALFIYNVNNLSSLTHIDDWLLVVRREIKSEQDTFPIVVVGIVPEFDEERQVSGEEGIRIAKSRGVNGFVECSPITGENVEETFEELTRIMIAKSGANI